MIASATAKTTPLGRVYHGVDALKLVRVVIIVLAVATACASAPPDEVELLDRIERESSLTCEERSEARDHVIVCRLDSGRILGVTTGDSTHQLNLVAAGAMDAGRPGPWIRGDGWLVETGSIEDAQEVIDVLGGDLIEDVDDLSSRT